MILVVNDIVSSKEINFNTIDDYNKSDLVKIKNWPKFKSLIKLIEWLNIEKIGWVYSNVKNDDNELTSWG